MSSPDGLLVVDKPAGLTSHDVVARCRRLCGTRKVGHAGTLDPMATGVLLIGVGRATRLLGHLALSDKAYDATIRLGETTVTDDAEGDVVTRVDASDVTVEAIQTEIIASDGSNPAATFRGLGHQDRRRPCLQARPGRRGRPAAGSRGRGHCLRCRRDTT